jgi:hypothetical protein
LITKNNQSSNCAAYGEAPEGQQVRHLCHNRLCCNPLHLLYGTPTENRQDSVRAGRLKMFARQRRLAARVGVAALGLLVGSALSAAVGGSTAVSLARGAEAPAVIELPVVSVEDKLRAQLGLERDRSGARINRLADQNRALRTQLRIERRRAKANLIHVDNRRRWDSAVGVGGAIVAWAKGEPAGDRFERQVRDVAGCEAGGARPGSLPSFTALGPTGDVGPLQYIRPTWMRTAPGRRGMVRIDPHASVVAAALNIAGGGSWQPWSASRHCHGHS